jgi:type I site-specific restriction endonuclease
VHFAVVPQECVGNQLLALVPKNASLFFTIFQTFMSGPPKEGQPSPYFGEYPPDFFDFIVIDECHRGGPMMKVIGAESWITLLPPFSSD